MAIEVVDASTKSFVRSFANGYDTTGRAVYAFDPVTGATLATWTLPELFPGAPDVVYEMRLSSDGAVLFVRGAGGIYALDTRTGAVVNTVAGTKRTAPAAADRLTRKSSFGIH